jgi:hypothetical protein
MQYMLNHVLLHQLDQMLNDQELNLVCNVKCMLQLIELEILSWWSNEKSCHLNFSYFSFYWCPFLIYCWKFFCIYVNILL